MNEILPKARNIDWNDDSYTNSNDEWIELYNGGPRAADISGWIIDTGDKTRAFTIPPGNSIPSLGYAVFFRRETKLELDTATQVRLLYPGGTVADAVRYPTVGDDQVYARAKDGAGDWRTECVPSPYAKNCVIEATATSSFGLGYFRETIAGPDRAFRLDVIVTNVLLAIILALAVGFFSNLLNDALESHESRVKQLFMPLIAVFQSIRHLGRRFDLWLERVHLGWLVFLLKLAVVLMLYGTLLAYLDPNFVFVNKDGALLILALALSAGMVSVIDDISVLLFLKRRGITSTVRLHSGNFALVFLSTMFSRWTGLTPGLLVGSPAGLEDVSDDSKVPPQVSFLAVGVTTIAALVAWLLAPLFADDAWLNSLLLLIFAAGIQTAFFEMFPVSYLHGRTILQTNRVVWAVWSAFLCAFFLQTMLNPDGAFVSAFDSPNMIILAAIVVAFCLASAALWLYLKRLESQAA